MQNPDPNALPLMDRQNINALLMRGRSRSIGRRARSVPDEFMIAVDEMLKEDHDPALDSIRLETQRMQQQLEKMDEFTQSQSARQQRMEMTSNELTNALTTVLTQVENQTAQHKELLQVHHNCLEEIKLRSETFTSSQKALEMTAEALIAQRDRDTEQYSQGMTALYQKTSEHEQLLTEKQQNSDHVIQAELRHREELKTMSQRTQQMEMHMISQQQTASAIPRNERSPQRDNCF